MKPVSTDDLRAFVTVVRAGSFTRAAIALGISQPALSRTIRDLEHRLATRLLNRTTRSLSPTDAGAALLAEVGPAFGTIEDAVKHLREAGDEPSGTVRLTADRHGHKLVLAPALPGFLRAHPRISVEVSLTDAFVDPVRLGFDGGLRLGDLIDRDMITRRVSPDVAFAVVASPDCPSVSAGHPRAPGDLAAHSCIAYRQRRTGGLHSWSFEKNAKRVSVQVEGQLVLDDGDAILDAALAGTGLAYLFLDQVQTHLDAGRLIRLLADWCPAMPGYRFYYPERRQLPPALAALIRHLKGSDLPQTPRDSRER